MLQNIPILSNIKIDVSMNHKLFVGSGLGISKPIFVLGFQELEIGSYLHPEFYLFELTTEAVYFSTLISFLLKSDIPWNFCSLRETGLMIVFLEKEDSFII